MREERQTDRQIKNKVKNEVPKCGIQIPENPDILSEGLKCKKDAHYPHSFSILFFKLNKARERN